MINKNRIIIFPVLLIIWFIFSVTSDMGIFRWYQLSNEKKYIKQKTKNLLEQETYLIDEIERLKNDTEYVKKIAQEKFHMVKSGEKVFRVINRKKLNNE